MPKDYCYETDESQLLKSLVLTSDPHRLNWVEGAGTFGEVTAPKGLETARRIEADDNGITVTWTFVNSLPAELFLPRGSIGIRMPFQDSYGPAAVCMANRCHAHVFCGLESTYVLCLRMNGQPPHLGMVLTEGSISDYSVERENKSNDRGDFLFHPAPCVLAPNEEKRLSVRLFRCSGRSDFFQKAISFGLIRVSAKHYTVFPNEAFEFSAETNAPVNNLSVTCSGIPLPVEVSDKTVRFTYIPKETGEYEFLIRINGKNAVCYGYCSAPAQKLIAARCRFIAEKQQYHRAGSHLDGAYLIWDREERSVFYERNVRDHNAGRERVCMGILIAKYLRGREDPFLKDSLLAYADFIRREIFNVSDGTVSNDVCHENTKVRLYNYPWVVRFFLELFDLFHSEQDLNYAVSAMRKYYELGGEKFYAFTIPAKRLADTLNAAGKNREAEEMIECFKRHAAVIIEKANNYPAHEVSYEQSIVAPAAELLLQMYVLTGEDSYLRCAKQQLDIMELFAGDQPHYRLYECAIRHWDGFWFGKNRMYGDTFPHYWNILSALALAEYGEISGQSSYLERAKEAYRGQLCQFSESGEATCAMLFPYTVNGKRTVPKDPWANDQDWALVYIADFLEHSGSL